MLEAELETGQGLFKDVKGRVGKIQIASAATSQLKAALNTNPVRGVVDLDEDYQSTTPHRREPLGAT